MRTVHGRAFVKQNNKGITATQCNTVQHSATHCNALQRTATQCITLQLFFILSTYLSIYISIVLSMYLYTHTLRWSWHVFKKKNEIPKMALAEQNNKGL